MTIQYRMDGALLPGDTVRVQGSDGTNNGFPAVAYLGQPGIADVRIDDPSGTLNIVGWHTFTVDETACAKPRIFTGWLLGRTISRGPYRTGAGRIWECQIIDQNALFSFEVFRSTNASVRPSETDVQRVQSALVSHAMAATPVYDNGRFNTSGGTGVGPGNFVAQTPAEMIGAAASQSGKNFYAYWDDSAGQISFHYDLVNVGPAAGLSISNVASDWTSDAGGTCYAPFIDAQEESDPTNIATGVLLHYLGGYVYDRNATLIDALSPTEFSPVNFLRDYVRNSDRIGKASTAASQLQIELDRHSREDIELTCTIQVTAAHVNLIREGDIVNVRFSHIPGFTSSTPTAVKSRQVEPVPQTSDQYFIHLTLTNSAASRGPGGVGVGVFPTPKCLASLVQEAEISDTNANIVGTGLDLTSTPVPGNLLVCWTVTRDVTDTITPTGFTAAGSAYQDDPATGGGHKTVGCRFYYRFVVAGDTDHIDFTRVGIAQTYVHISEWAGVDQFDGLSVWTNDEDSAVDPLVLGTATVTPVADRAGLLIGGIMPSLNTNDAWHPHGINSAIDLGASGVGDISSGGPNAKSWLGYKTPPKTSTPQPTVLQLRASPTSGNCRGYAGLTMAFSGPCADTPADPGQPVIGETPDSVGGGQTDFTTSIPYAEGSLKVYVDGIRQPAVETDPETGAFQLYFDPLPSEYVSWDFQARSGG